MTPTGPETMGIDAATPPRQRNYIDFRNIYCYTTGVHGMMTNRDRTVRFCAMKGETRFPRCGILFFMDL